MKIIICIAATFAGLLLGGIGVSLVQLISSLIYPAPPNIDLNQSDQMADWVKTLPIGAFLIVLISWGIGPLIGAFVTRRMSPQRIMGPALFVWLLFGLATISMLVILPHPWWMWPGGLLVWFLSGLLGLSLSAPHQIEILIVRTIQAPLSLVFQTLSQPNQFAKAVPNIVNIEVVSPEKSGVGTRFRETRSMNGKTAVVEMEVTEQVENKLIRLVAEMGGSVWETCFTLRSGQSSVEMDVLMTAQAKNLLARLINPMLIRMIEKGVAGDMDHVRAYCEKSRPMELQD